MIKIVRGNDFKLSIPVEQKTGVDSDGKPILQPYDLSKVSNLKVVLKSQYSSHTLSFEVDGNVITCRVSGNLPNGVYNIEITGIDENSMNIRSYELSQFKIVDSNQEADLYPSELDVTTVQLSSLAFINSGNGSGISDYLELTNKPKLNGVELCKNRFTTNRLRVNRIGDKLPLIHPKGYVFAGKPKYRQIRKSYASGCSYYVDASGKIAKAYRNDICPIKFSAYVYIGLIDYGEYCFYNKDMEVTEDIDKICYVKGEVNIYEYIPESEQIEGVYVSDTACHEEGHTPSKWKRVALLTDFEYCYCKNKNSKCNTRQREKIKCVSGLGTFFNSDKHTTLINDQYNNNIACLIADYLSSKKLDAPFRYLDCVNLLKNLASLSYMSIRFRIRKRRVYYGIMGFYKLRWAGRDVRRCLLPKSYAKRHVFIIQAVIDYKYEILLYFHKTIKNGIETYRIRWKKC